MVYRPNAAMLVELHPTHIRYFGMSLLYYIAQRLVRRHSACLAAANVVSCGNIHAGLWYPLIVALMTVVIGVIFVPGGSQNKSIFADDARR